MLPVQLTPMVEPPCGEAAMAVGAVGALVPLPENATVIGEPALLVMLSVPDTLPAAVGWKVTEIWQALPPARLLWH